MRLSVSLFLVLGLASLPSRAYRFESPSGGSTTNPSQADRWPAGAMPIPWELATNATSKVGPSTTSAQVRQAAIDGFASWSAAAPAIRMGTAQSLAAGSQNAQDDGHNRIFWEETGWTFGTQTLGVTTPWSTSNGTIVDADIQFNAQNWKWQVGNGNYQTCSGCLDAKSITTHEEGHFLGMAHSCETNEINPNGPSTSCPAAQFDAVMVAYYESPKQQLNSDDIAGIRLLYPSATPHSGPQGSICASSTDCVSGLECVAAEGGGTTICTTACTSSCPTGYTCQASTSGQACLPPAAAGAGELCKACGSGADCPNGLCLSTETFAYCTIACSQTAGCPAGYACVAAQGSSQSFCYPASQTCANNCGSGCPSGQACVGGTCTLQPAGDGQSCETSPCQNGLVCAGTTATDATCHETCTPGGANTCPAGESCFGLSDGSGNSTNEGACFSGTDTGGTGQEGQACATSGCVSGLVCVGSAADGSDAVCRKSCGASAPCPSGESCEPLNGGGGACVPGDSSAGAGRCEACGNGVGCESGLVCVRDSSGTFCRKGCSSQASCDGDTTCVSMSGIPGGDTGVCSCGAAEGGACTADGDCEAGLVCIDDQTQTPAACRKSCASDSDCASGESCTTIGHAKVCESASIGNGNGSDGGTRGSTTPIVPCGCASGGPGGLLLSLVALAALLRRRKSGDGLVAIG